MSHDFRLSVDIVVPTVRANASGLRRVVELTVPPAFANLKIIIVVDGPQTADAWNALRSLAAERPLIQLLSTRPNHHGWPAGAGAARNTGIEHSSADFSESVHEITAELVGIRIAFFLEGFDCLTVTGTSR